MTPIDRKNIILWLEDEIARLREQKWCLDVAIREFEEAKLYHERFLAGDEDLSAPKLK